MVPIKYKIHRLSARAVMGYAKETAQGIYLFHLNGAATEKCKTSTQVEQDDNALFYQIMDELHGGNFALPTDGKVVTDLSEILFYMDFAGIFDRTGMQKKYLDRQKKAECMFRPEGITLDFGSGPHRYLAFERSASMSRRAMLSFIREDFYEPIRKRIMMDLTIGQCQLSKLYAYNGLMMSSGIRVDGIGIDLPHRVIVIDNPTFKNHNVKVITVEDDGSTGSMRKYHREEKRIDELVTVCFDGEGSSPTTKIPPPRNGSGTGRRWKFWRFSPVWRLTLPRAVSSLTCRNILLPRISSGAASCGLRILWMPRKNSGSGMSLPRQSG